MRYIIVALITLGLSVVTTDALAQPTEFCERVKECDPPVVKKKRRKKRKRKVVKPVVGPKGDVGPRGVAGPRGLPGKSRTVVMLVERPAKPRLTFNIGYMAAAFKGGWNEWAHGPSLRINSRLNAQKTLLLEVGYAPGRAGAVMVRTSVTHWLQRQPAVGITLGTYAQFMGTSKKGRVDVVALNPQISIRKPIGKFNFELGIGPALGLARSPEFGTEVVAGAAGSVGVSYNW